MKTTLDPQLRWFQIRILHRLIPTNRFLYLRKLVNSLVCTFCGTEEETAIHMFWECIYAQRLWAGILSWLQSECTHCDNLSFSVSFIIFGTKPHCRTDKVLDLLILLAKLHIFKNKLQNNIPSIVSYKNVVKHRYNIERYSNMVAGTLNRFISDWLPYLPLLN